MMKKAIYRAGKALILTVVMAAGWAHAQGYCGAVSEPGLSFGCAETLSPAAFLNGEASPARRVVAPLIGSNAGLVFDTDAIRSRVEPQLRFATDLASTNPLHSSFENVHIGSSRNDGGRTARNLTAASDGITGQPTVLQVRLDFGRLTLENTDLTLRRALLSPTELGFVSDLTLGNDTAGRSGALILRNASLSILNGTNLSLASPGGPPSIIAQSGANELSLGRQQAIADDLVVRIDPGAGLNFRNTIVAPRLGGGRFRSRPADACCSPARPWT